MQCFIEKKKILVSLDTSEDCIATLAGHAMGQPHWGGHRCWVPPAPPTTWVPEPSPRAPGVSQWLMTGGEERREFAQVGLMPCFPPQHGWLSLAPSHPRAPWGQQFPQAQDLLLTCFYFPFWFLFCFVFKKKKPPHIFALLKSPTYDYSARGLGTSEHYQHAVGGQSSPINIIVGLKEHRISREKR